MRRILLTHSYGSDTTVTGKEDALLADLTDGEDIDVQTLLAAYCRRLYKHHGTYEEVARRLKLDRRTVKKYLQGENKDMPAGPGASTSSQRGLRSQIPK